MSSYRTLIVWQKAVRLSKEIYKITEQYPSSEKFGLISQLQRSSVSIGSNIAEGRSFTSKAKYHHYLSMALGSCYEIDTQLEISQSLPWAQKINFSEVQNLLIEVMKMLHTIMRKLK